MQKNSFGYPVEFSTDLFGADEKLAQTLTGHNILIVADFNLVEQTTGLGAKIGRYVHDHDLSLVGKPVILMGGEKIKVEDYAGMRPVMNAAIANELTVDSCILAIGGGAVLDVAGYVATQVRGGVGVVRIPTSPEGMLDAAFADRAYLNTRNEKDALSLPSVPKAVFIDMTFAKTVLDGVWRGGVSEAVRLAIAHKSATLLKTLDTMAERYGARDQEALETIVTETVKLRGKKGATELGLAAAADLEARSAWKLPHGYAVALGTLIDLVAETKAGTREVDEVKRYKDILQRCGALDGLAPSRRLLPPEVADF